MNINRRKFIKGIALTGIATACLPTLDSIASINEGTQNLKQKMEPLYFFREIPLPMETGEETWIPTTLWAMDTLLALPVVWGLISPGKS